MSESRISISEIKRLAEEVQRDSPIGACRRATSDLAKKLKDKLEDDPVQVQQGYFDGKEGLVEHFYLIIDSSAIENNTKTEMIVDPTIRQFTRENYYEGVAETYVVETESELPSVGIFDKTDPEYRWYQ